jgi:hypothetical protein
MVRPGVADGGEDRGTGRVGAGVSALQRGRHEEDDERQQHEREHSGTEEVPKAWLHGWRSSDGSIGRAAEPYRTGALVVAPGERPSVFAARRSAREPVLASSSERSARANESGPRRCPATGPCALPLHSLTGCRGPKVDDPVTPRDRRRSPSRAPRRETPMWSVRGHRAEDSREEHEDRAARQRDEREALDELCGDRPADHVDETPQRGGLLQSRRGSRGDSDSRTSVL